MVTNGAAAEHGADPNGPLSDVFKAEDRPAETDQKQRVQVTQSLRQFCGHVQQEQFFQDQQDAEIDAPEYEIPAGAVPETGEQPYDRDIAQLLGKAAAAAAERDVDIITKPAAHRDMPAPPEICDAVRDKRIVEVFREVEAQHAAEADRHVRITGKVEVDLESVSDRAKPGSEHRRRGLRGSSFPEKTDVVGEQDLFGEPADEAAGAFRKQIRRVIAVLQLFGNRLIADDGAGDQLREERDVGSEVQQIFLCFDFTAVDVDCVAHCLERIERDPDRQRQVRLREVCSEQAVQRSDQKITVFEDAEQAEVAAERDQQRDARLVPRRCLLCAEVFDGAAAAVVEQGRKDHQHDVDRFAPGVKQQARQQQDEIFALPRHEEVDQQA